MWGWPAATLVTRTTPQSSIANWGRDTMPETKEDVTAERDKRRAENEQLRAQLQAAGGAGSAVGRASVPQHVFQLSEGDRQELEIRGAINVGGRLMTKADVE